MSHPPARSGGSSPAGAFTEATAAAPPDRALALDPIDGLADRQHDQQAPEVVAVGQVGEWAAVNAATEAIEGAEGHILLVLDRPRAAVVPELLARQENEPLEVALPEVLCRGITAGSQVADPAQ